MINVTLVFLKPMFVLLFEMYRIYSQYITVLGKPCIYTKILTSTYSLSLCLSVLYLFVYYDI